MAALIDERIRFYELFSTIAKETKFAIPNRTIKRIRSIQNRLLHVKTNLSSVYDHLLKIENLYTQCTQNTGDESLKYALFLSIDELYEFWAEDVASSNSSEYNTEDYYKKTISGLEKRIDDLNQKLDGTKQSDKQKEKIRKELEESKEQIEQIKAEKEELEKKIDAQDNIKKKISSAFGELKKHISHLEIEKLRLNRMFNAYAILCICVLLLLVIFEINYLLKWETPTQWTDYLPFYIPIPIVGGLLWAFIYQMNRAQRQLILVAYELYHVDYVEGLLQAINMVSPNAASASEKIVNVLDFLIKKHISIPNDLFEKSLDKEISKDNVDLNTFVNMAKEVKDVLK